MQINNSKTFKVERADPAQDPNTDQALRNQIIDPADPADLFDLGVDGVDSTQYPADPDPLTGYAISGNNGTSSAYDDAILERLANFPPALADILAQREDGIRQIDMLKALYEKSYDDLNSLQANYRELLATMPLNAEQVSILQQKIDLISRRLPFISEQILECDRIALSTAELYAYEAKHLVDANHDMIIGDPSDKENALGITITPEGKKCYHNIVTGEQVPPPFYRESDSVLTTDDSLEVISAEEAQFDPETHPELAADIHLRLTDLQGVSNPYENRWGTAINLAIPQYWWVPSNGYSGEMNTDAEYPGYAQAEELLRVDGDGIRQDISLIENKADYRQINVAGARIVSERDPRAEAGEDSPGGYIHIVELFDKDDNVLCRISIEGYTTSQENAASALLESGEHCVYASSVGFSLDGSYTTEPMEIDASYFISQARQILDGGFYETIGIPPDLIAEYEDNNNADQYMAAEEHRAFFEDRSYTNQFWQVTHYGSDEDGADGRWMNFSHEQDFSMPSGGLSSVCRSTENSTEFDTVSSQQSGIFMSGFRGAITGSRYNDIVIMSGANEYSDRIPEDMLADKEPIGREDAAYKSTYTSNGGNNVIVQDGEGDLYADHIGFAYINAGSRDAIGIAVTEENVNYNSDRARGADDPDLVARIVGTTDQDMVRAHPESDEYQDSRRNTKNHVHIANAGNVFFVDPELNYETVNDAANDGLNNDYYNLDGGRWISTNNPGNPDIHNFGNLSGDQEIDENGVSDIIATASQEILDYIQEINALDTTYNAQTVWEENGQNYNEMAEETAAFFESMFGEFDSFQAELDQLRATGSV